MLKLSDDDGHVVDLLMEVPDPDAFPYALAAPDHLAPRVKAVQQIMGLVAAWPVSGPPAGLGQRTMALIAEQTPVGEESAELVRPPAR